MATDFTFTRDWFSAAIPAWRSLFAPWRGRPSVRFLEIGVYEGRATVWLLRHVLTADSARLDCVDPFVWKCVDGRPARVSMQAVKRRFYRNVSATGAAHKVRLMEAPSEIALRALPLDAYDCIYIDGSHRAPDVLADAVLSFRLVKPNGLLVFDDYGLAVADQGRSSLSVPKDAIDAFLHIYRERLEVVLSGYQVAVRRREGT